MKSKGVAYLLWFACFIGLCGIHRFYIGKVGTGILWLLTFGLLGIGQLVDLFILGNQVDLANMQYGGLVGGNRQTQNVIVNIPNHINNPDTNKKEIDISEEIRKYARLFEEGHISKEEYDNKKSSLLRL